MLLNPVKAEKQGLGCSSPHVAAILNCCSDLASVKLKHGGRYLVPSGAIKGTKHFSNIFNNGSYIQVLHEEEESITKIQFYSLLIIFIGTMSMLIFLIFVLKMVKINQEFQLVFLVSSFRLSWGC